LCPNKKKGNRNLSVREREKEIKRERDREKEIKRERDLVSTHQDGSSYNPDKVASENQPNNTLILNFQPQVL
jgi:hypothetical protein